MQEISLKQIVVSYFIAAVAGVFAFLLALNIRALVVTVYILNTDGIPWAMAFINAIAIILLMICWIIYVFCAQHYFEKKCRFTLAAFKGAVLKLVVPVFALYIVSEALMRFWPMLA